MCVHRIPGLRDRLVVSVLDCQSKKVIEDLNPLQGRVIFGVSALSTTPI